MRSHLALRLSLLALSVGIIGGLFAYAAGPRRLEAAATGRMSLSTLIDDTIYQRNLPETGNMPLYMFERVEATDDLAYYRLEQAERAVGIAVTPIEQNRLAPVIRVAKSSLGGVDGYEIGFAHMTTFDSIIVDTYDDGHSKSIFVPNNQVMRILIEDGAHPDRWRYSAYLINGQLTNEEPLVFDQISSALIIMASDQELIGLAEPY